MSVQLVLQVLTDIIKDSNRQGSELHVVHIDFKKAFDSVHHEALFEALTYYGLGANFMDLIHHLSWL